LTQLGLSSTATLVRQIQAGDEAARALLVERCLPLLKRWARGRLPSYGRDLSETDDIVQTTLMKSFDGMERFEANHPGAFLAYLRQILLNTVRDEVRRSQVRSGTGELTELNLDRVSRQRPSESSLRETLDEYERALDNLANGQREAVILRVEFGMTFPEIAAELELPSASAARMKVTRALKNLATVMS
jgi:RNA polymerase sigma-70 factor (ECF subfamily)